MVRIPFEKVAELVVLYPELSGYLSCLVSHHYFTILNHLHSSQETDTSIRLYRLLLQLALPEGTTYRIHKHFNYSELAKYLGVHFVTISRIMAELKQAGIITKAGHATIITDVAALTRLAQTAD